MLFQETHLMEWLNKDSNLPGSFEDETPQQQAWNDKQGKVMKIQCMEMSILASMCWLDPLYACLNNKLAS